MKPLPLSSVLNVFLVGGTETSTENWVAFILFRVSSLLLGEGKVQEEEGMWPDELFAFFLPFPLLSWKLYGEEVWPGMLWREEITGKCVILRAGKWDRKHRTPCWSALMLLWPNAFPLSPPQQSWEGEYFLPETARISYAFEVHQQETFRAFRQLLLEHWSFIQVVPLHEKNNYYWWASK